MRAVIQARTGAIDLPGILLDTALPDPVPGPHDLLVSVRAVSVNPVDTKIRAGAVATESERKVLGWDASGVVQEVGAAVQRFRPGDAVFYAGELRRPGSNASLQTVDARLVGRKPDTLSFAAAAALPLTALTAWELLFDRLGVAPGRKRGDAGTLLVVNGAGGVGSILVQLARRLTALRVIATASRPETERWCREMGGHEVVDHRRPLDAALRAIGVAQVEYVAALTATEHHAPALASLVAPQGRIGIIDDPATLDIVPFKSKSVSLHWELMYTRSLFRTGDMGEQGRILDEVADLVDAGLLRSTMTNDAGVLDAATLAAVHRTIESGRAIGKTVLRVDPA